MTTCSPYFAAELAACPESILIKASLLHVQPYTIVFIDKNGTRYHQEITSDSNGSLTIIVKDEDGTYNFPKGLFTAYSGFFDLLIYNADKQQVTFTMCGSEVVGFSLSFYNGSGVNDNIVQSQCNIVNNSPINIGYFQKAFTFDAGDYSIPATEHKLSKIFSIELLVLIDGSYQNVEFSYDLDPDTQDITLHSLVTEDCLITMTGIAAS